MNWTPNKDKPICPQLCEHICVCIANGDYSPGEKLPSVREMAVMTGVNPNTVQRSYEILEQRGIVVSVRNSGNFVSEDIAIAKDELESMRKQKISEFFSAMKALGVDAKAVIKYIEEWNK